MMIMIIIIYIDYYDKIITPYLMVAKKRSFSLKKKTNFTNFRGVLEVKSRSNICNARIVMNSS